MTNKSKRLARGLVVVALFVATSVADAAGGRRKETLYCIQHAGAG